MQDFDTHEQRLVTALQRIANAAERLHEAPVAAAAAVTGMDTAAEVEIARLNRLLERSGTEAQAREQALMADLAALQDALDRVRAEGPGDTGGGLDFDPVAIRALIDEALAEQEQALAAASAATIAPLQQRLASLGAQLASQAEDARRLRAMNLKMRSALRDLRETLSSGVVDAHLINRALEEELAALQGLRQVDLGDLDRLLAALDPLLQPGDDAADAAPEGPSALAEKGADDARA